MNEQSRIIAEYLENAYVGARAMDDFEAIIRIARAITAFNLNIEKNCKIEESEV